ncbi:MAG: DUF2892 domain-containing protein [Bacteroidia bacterium]|nr:DUF2892 domain-containing protein [Bacteroidia bacterium]
MKTNMGKWDKIIRIVLAVLFAVLYFTHLVEGTVGIILLVLGIIFILTSLVGFCPLYLPFNINTKKDSEK